MSEDSDSLVSPDKSKSILLIAQGVSKHYFFYLNVINEGGDLYEKYFCFLSTAGGRVGKRILNSA